MWCLWERKKHVNKHMRQINVEKMPKGSKEGTDKLLYVGSKKKKRYKLIYLQNSSRVADVEDKLIEGGGRGVHV